MKTLIKTKMLMTITVVLIAAQGCIKLDGVQPALGGPALGGPVIDTILPTPTPVPPIIVEPVPPFPAPPVNDTLPPSGEPVPPIIVEPVPPFPAPPVNDTIPG